jgi:SagB-type dehydrogenase family enzyme
MNAKGTVRKIVDEYHIATRNSGAFRDNLRAHQVHYEPHIQELVRTAPLHLDGEHRVTLPPSLPLDLSLGEAIARRSSGRLFSAEPLSVDVFATILRSGNALFRRENGNYRRTAASSGNLGSVEVFPIVLNVAGIDAGIYHFDTVRHDLSLVRRGQFSDFLRSCGLYQIEFAEAAAALVLVGAIGRLAAKYGPRAHRLATLDAGHVSENIYLAGTALKLAVCATAGFVDEEFDRALGIDGMDMATLLVLLIGTDASESKQ